MYRTWLHGTTRVRNIPRRRSPASSAQVTLRRLRAANHPTAVRPAPAAYAPPLGAPPMAPTMISSTPQPVKMTANTAIPTVLERAIRYSRAFTPPERASGTGGFPGGVQGNRLYPKASGRRRKAAMAGYESIGLALGGQRAQATFNDSWPQPVSPDCVVHDVFAPPPARALSMT